MYPKFMFYVYMCIQYFSERSNPDLGLVVRKPVFGVSEQVRHKPGCTATKDDYRLKISDLESRGIVLSV